MRVVVKELLSIAVTCPISEKKVGFCPLVEARHLHTNRSLLSERFPIHHAIVRGTADRSGRPTNIARQTLGLRTRC